MRNGLLGTLAVMLAGTSALAQTTPAVRLGRPVPLHQAVQLQKPVAVDSGVVQASATSTGGIYRAAAPGADPFLGPPQPAPPPGAVPLTPAPPPPMAPCGCGPCDHRFWVSGEYLIWWVKDGPLPLGDTINFGAFSGIRLNAGAWIDANSRFGIEGSGFTLERRATGANGAGIVDTPPLVMLTGSAAVNATSQLYGAEANGLFNLVRGDRAHVDLLGGFRYLGLQEDIQASAVGNGLFLGLPFTGTAASRVMTQNNFYGGQVGARAGVHAGRWHADITGKLAMGYIHESVNVSASATDLNFGTTIGFNSRATRNEFALIPELIVRVGFDVTTHMHVFVAYDYLYINKVARPGNQDVLSYLGAGPTIADSNFWAQGVSLGLEFTF